MLISLFSQTVIALIVVAVYHVWVSQRREQTDQSITPVVRQPPAIVPASVVMAPQQTPPSPPPVSKSVDSLEGEIAAVIAAAVSVVLDGPLRILSVQPVTATPYLNVWAFEGRLEIFTSHRVR
jgi:hypothetical protein